MSEQHRMKVRWSGERTVAEKLAEIAANHGCSPAIEDDGPQATLSVEVGSKDLQTLRDNVDALLVAFAQVEEQRNG